MAFKLLVIEEDQELREEIELVAKATNSTIEITTAEDIETGIGSLMMQNFDLIICAENATAAGDQPTGAGLEDMMHLREIRSRRIAIIADSSTPATYGFPVIYREDNTRQESIAKLIFDWLYEHQ